MSAVLSQVSVWGIRNLPCSEWRRFGAVWGQLLARHRPLARTASGCSPDELSAVRLLVLCGKRNKGTGNGDKVNCAGNMESLSLSTRTKRGGCISRSTVVVGDRREIKSLPLPPGILLACAPALTLWKKQGDEESSVPPGVLLMSVSGGESFRLHYCFQGRRSVLSIVPDF